MTVAEAGTYYLSAICPSNEAGYAVFQAIQDVQSTYGGKVQRKAAQAAAVFRDVAELLDDPPLPWPADVKNPVGKVVKQLLDDMAAASRLADAETYRDAELAYADFVKGTRKSANLVRLRLDLPPAIEGEDGCPKS